MLAIIVFIYSYLRAGYLSAIICNFLHVKDNNTRMEVILGNVKNHAQAFRGDINAKLSASSKKIPRMLSVFPDFGHHTAAR